MLNFSEFWDNLLTTHGTPREGPHREEPVLYNHTWATWAWYQKWEVIENTSHSLRAKFWLWMLCSNEKRRDPGLSLSLASLSTKHKMPRLCCEMDSRQSLIFSNTAEYGMVSEWPSGLRRVPCETKHDSKDSRAIESLGIWPQTGPQETFWAKPVLPEAPRKPPAGYRWVTLEASPPPHEDHGA